MTNWKAGDLALCIAPFVGRGAVPVKGVVHTVLAVWQNIETPDGEKGDGLFVLPEDFTNYEAWGVLGFQKIQPFQERFAEQLRAALPTNEKEPAIREAGEREGVGVV